MKTSPEKTFSLPSSSVFRFIFITYGFTWLVWLPGILASRGILPAVPWQPLFALGTCGPLLAAVWNLHREGGWGGVKSWLIKGFSVRFRPGLWLGIILIPFTVPLLALGIHRWGGGSLSELPVFANPLVILPAILLMVTIGGGQEEYGWRGYLLPKLDSMVSPWKADLILILVHVLWHLPLFFIVYTFQSQYPFWVFTLFGFGFSPLINRFFRKTGGSILAAVLFHGLVNAGLEVFPPVGSAVAFSPFPLLIVGGLFALINLAWFSFGQMRPDRN